MQQLLYDGANPGSCNHCRKQLKRGAFVLQYIIYIHAMKHVFMRLWECCHMCLPIMQPLGRLLSHLRPPTPPPAPPPPPPPPPPFQWRKAHSPLLHSSCPVIFYVKIALLTRHNMYIVHTICYGLHIISRNNINDSVWYYGCSSYLTFVLEDEKTEDKHNWIIFPEQDQ